MSTRRRWRRTRSSPPSSRHLRFAHFVYDAAAAYLSSVCNMRRTTARTLYIARSGACVYLRRMPNQCPFILPLLSPPNSVRIANEIGEMLPEPSEWLLSVMYRVVKIDRIYVILTRTCKFSRTMMHVYNIVN